MSFTVTTTQKPEEAANFIVSSVLSQLKSGKRVLFFVTGGSSIAVGVKVAEFLEKHAEENLFKNLTIMLTDERYGLIGHADSNWQQLTEKGFSIPGAKLIPILTGDTLGATTKKFETTLNEELTTTEENNYKIGLFGIGPDGHTAGILPESDAVKTENLVFHYETPTFSRITITPKVIEKLDQAVVWVQGEEKWGVINDLISNVDKDILKQPAQILKKVPLLNIFTDYPDSRA